MVGIQHVEVSNRKAKYRFDLVRNITIIRGDSGTGKTTLYDMISDHTRLGDASGVTVSCDKSCVALVDMDWKNQLAGIRDSIVFIDEGADYLAKEEFASFIKKTDNYYVIFNREGMHQLPYSVDEIYRIKTSGKYHSFEKMFQSKPGHLYELSSKHKKVAFDNLITEDSKSGFQFYKEYFKNDAVECFSAGSNSAIYGWLKDNLNERTLIIADGAAFGSEMDRIMKLQAEKPNEVKVCLPESFEWLILKSGLIKGQDIISVLDNPSDYIDSKKHFSWERFFTDYLVNQTEKTPFQYQKRKINSVYLLDENRKKIIQEIKDAIK